MIADKVLKCFTTDNCLSTLLQIDEICYDIQVHKNVKLSIFTSYMK